MIIHATPNSFCSRYDYNNSLGKQEQTLKVNSQNPSFKNNHTHKLYTALVILLFVIATTLLALHEYLHRV